MRYSKVTIKGLTKGITATGKLTDNTLTSLHQWDSTRCIYFSASILNFILIISIIYKLTVIIA